VLGFAGYAQMIMNATSRGQEDIVRTLMNCVIELSEASLDIEKTLASKLMNEAIMPKTITANANKPEVTEGAGAYFEDKVVSLIPQQMKSDLIHKLSEAIRWDSTISKDTKENLLALANENTLANFLSHVFLYVLYKPNHNPSDGAITITEHSNLPERNEYFTGREKHLENIHALFSKKGRSINTRQAVSGLGGVGKTQLAIEYAYRRCKDYKNCIWFVNAESSMTARDYFAEFAEHFGLGLPRNFKLNELQHAVKAWLANNTKWLLILDNLEFEDVIQPYLPEKINGRILVTTRNTDIVKPLELDTFDKNEALSFIKRRLSYDEKCGLEYYSKNFKDFEPEAPKLAGRLGYLPLALEQAVAYIKEVKSSIASYMSMLDQSGLEVFEDSTSKPEYYVKANEHEKIVTATWSISFKAIIHDGSRQLMNLCAYMASDRIPVEFFSEMCSMLPLPVKEDVADILVRNRIVTELRKYSLTGGTAEHISIHRLVQEVVRKHHLREKEIKWHEICFDMIEEYIPNDVRTYSENYAVTKKFISIAEHCDAVTGHFSSKCVNEAEYERVAFTYHRLGGGYYATGEYSKSMEIKIRIISMLEQYVGETHPLTTTMYFNMANGHKLQGDFSTALELYEKVLATFEELYDFQIADTAMAYNGMSEVYRHQGKYDLAYEWANKALHVHKQFVVEEDLFTAKLYLGLASIYYDKGKYKDSLDLNYKALSIRQSVLGENNATTASVYTNIAQVYKAQGDYPKARELYYKAFEIQENIWGKEHPTLAIVRFNIAGLYHSEGDFSKSLELYEKSLSVIRKAWGEEHHSTALLYNNMAGVYESMADYAKAFSLYEKALTIQKNILGMAHPETLKSCSNIAAAYSHISDYEEALIWHFAVLDGREEVLGVNHPDTILTYSNIGSTYNHQGDLDNALKFYNKALLYYEKNMGAEHPDTANVYNNIGSIHYKQKKYDIALSQLYKALEIREKTFGSNHRLVASTIGNIAAVHHSQKKYDDALHLYNKALIVNEDVYGTEHPNTASLYNNIAALHLDRGENDLALDLFCRAVIVMSLCGLRSHPLMDSYSTALCDCFEVSSEKDKNFEKWFEERVLTYPQWCTQ